MPQLVKGGKYVFGWSRIRDNGQILIPGEAIDEYRLRPETNVILMSGSKTSGGFIIADKALMERSALGNVFKENPGLADLQFGDGKIISHKERKYGCTSIENNNTVKLDKQLLEAFGLKPGDDLLSARGSYMGIGMIARGPIFEYARKHPEIERFA